MELVPSILGIILLVIGFALQLASSQVTQFATLFTPAMYAINVPLLVSGIAVLAAGIVALVVGYRMKEKLISTKHKVELIGIAIMEIGVALGIYSSQIIPRTSVIELGIVVFFAGICTLIVGVTMEEKKKETKLIEHVPA